MSITIKYSSWPAEGRYIAAQGADGGGADGRRRQSRVKDISRDVLLTGKKNGLPFFDYGKLFFSKKCRRLVLL